MTFRAKMMSVLILGFAGGATIPLTFVAFGTVGVIVFLCGVVAVAGIAFAVTCAQKDMLEVTRDGMVAVEIVEDVTVERLDNHR